MPDVAFVHGIGQEQLSADVLEEQWTPALAGGLRLAGFPDLADAARGRAAGCHTLACRMAFYGDVFLQEGQQGNLGITLTPQQSDLVELLASACLERLAGGAATNRLRLEAIRQVALLRSSPETTQGLRATGRTAIAALARVPVFAHMGMALAEQFVVRALTQVTLYLTNDEVRERAIASLLSIIDHRTKVVIGHSLGSVVAYEALHRTTQRIPLLVTIGSPLGLRTIIYERITPQPPRVPPAIEHWINVADPDDIVAAQPNLRALFADGARIVDFATVNNGDDPHRAEFYLAKSQTATPIGKALTTAFGT